MEFRVVDPRIKPVVLGLLRKYPFIDDDYLAGVFQIEDRIRRVDGWYTVGIYDRVTKSIGYFWPGTSYRPNPDVYQVVAHEVFHAVMAFVQERGGRIIFDMPQHELASISAYAVNAGKDEEVICEAMAYHHIGIRNPAINYIADLVIEEVNRVQKG